MSEDQTWPIGEHLDGCPRPGWTLADLDGWDIATCSGCGARRLVLPDDVSTPRERHRAGRPYHHPRLDRGQGK